MHVGRCSGWLLGMVLLLLPVSTPEAAATPQEAGKVTVVYDEDPAALRFLLEADPRYEAP